jgi:2,4-dienoyl-CoA reductase-like NADH-dependent reductase (Old Yellow Enzyme family)
VTPVEVSVFPDTTLSRGGVPSSLWDQPGIKARFRKAAPTRRRRAALMAGSWIGAKRSPFAPVWNRDLFMAAKERVSIPVLAVGGIRRASEVHAILDGGQADLVGIGRPFYAEPDLAERILGADERSGLCVNSNKCVPAQMLGMKGACYNPDVVKKRARS